MLDVLIELIAVEGNARTRASFKVMRQTSRCSASRSAERTVHYSCTMNLGFQVLRLSVTPFIPLMPWSSPVEYYLSSETDDHSQRNSHES
jgi:hypothetical protein